MDAATTETRPLFENELPSSTDEFATLPLKPIVFCDRCQFALIYDEIEGRRILRHPLRWALLRGVLGLDARPCEREGQVFEAPTMELKKIR